MQSGWPIPFPKEEVASIVDQGEAWVVEKGGDGNNNQEIVATFRLVWSDPVFWGEQPPIAGYLHKLAVKRAFSHQGIGTRILELAQNQVTQNGRNYLRLDCVASNSYIVGYYKAHGFKPIKVVKIKLPAGVETIQLMEKQLKFR